MKSRATQQCNMSPYVCAVYWPSSASLGFLLDRKCNWLAEINNMRNATCVDTQTSIEWPYCPFLYCDSKQMSHSAKYRIRNKWHRTDTSAQRLAKLSDKNIAFFPNTQKGRSNFKKWRCQPVFVEKNFQYTLPSIGLDIPATVNG